MHYYSAESLLEAALKCRHIDLEGIYSHFANADDLDLTHARLQLERFQEVLSFYEKRSLPPPPLRHMANSPAILQLPEATLTWCAPACCSTASIPARDSRTVAVRPALSWKSRWSTSRSSSRVTRSATAPPGRPITWCGW